ncbi:MAG: hypothetical protein EAZ92_00770 [Candidatus Kapaibacterium sp.]|nr:MAG: hypothetical protein EAZ92_00770 [Candidatus Kapabacteria bacterium]
MARNTGNGGRVGSVTGRTQTKTPSGHFVKRDADNGRFTEVKTSDKTPFKGVAQESDGRRTTSK